VVDKVTRHLANPNRSRTHLSLDQALMLTNLLVRGEPAKRRDTTAHVLYAQACDEVAGESAGSGDRRRESNS
jgi:hypothetical protein